MINQYESTKYTKKEGTKILGSFYKFDVIDSRSKGMNKGSNTAKYKKNRFDEY